MAMVCGIMLILFFAFVHKAQRNKADSFLHSDYLDADYSIIQRLDDFCNSAGKRQ